IAAALKEAFQVSGGEQRRRNHLMQRRLRRYNVRRWASDFLNSLLGMEEIQKRIESKLLTPTVKNEIMARYRVSRRRLLFFDYDGTLTPLVRHPEMAKPDPSIITLLKRLVDDTRNCVVITSGRDRRTLEEWLGELPLGLVAEHGAWSRRAGLSWQRTKAAANEWKRELVPTLEIYADRLPGSFVEEKEESLAWHYRLTDPEQAELRAPELVDHLVNLTAKTDLQVVQGNKVVEVRRAGVDKGSAAGTWIDGGEFDFILALGDDATDEDLFRSLPPQAISIRVGIGGTDAQHNIRNSAESLELLRSLADAGESNTIPPE
ncbi:MAG TPA: trehalose-phosphatase, partial [Pyrinomonadaceae bacterium]|nr:trehalose-phosphatase [Pyrinomonadaceae bacterium]